MKGKYDRTLHNLPVRAFYLRENHEMINLYWSSFWNNYMRSNNGPFFRRRKNQS